MAMEGGEAAAAAVAKKKLEHHSSPAGTTQAELNNRRLALSSLSFHSLVAIACLAGM